ncbi:hypothetical protein ACHAXT_003307 [Thalassiosira profunda]
MNIMAGMVWLSGVSAFSARRAIRPSTRLHARASTSLAFQTDGQLSSSDDGRQLQQTTQSKFTITAPYPPTADQPQAIQSIVDGVERGDKYSILRGCTGTGKTMVMAHTIARLGKPALVLCHNKTLAAQLARELRSFLNKNHVQLFVSYYNHYVPESYSETTGKYIAKKSSINDELDTLRHMATRALVQHRDVVVVASVSCIYGMGMPAAYLEKSFTWKTDGTTTFTSMQEAIDVLEANVYGNSLDENSPSYTGDLSRGQYELSDRNATSASIALWPPYELFPLRIDLESDGGYWRVRQISRGTNVGMTQVDELTVFPSKHHVSDSAETFEEALRRIQNECTDRCAELRRKGKAVEAGRLQQRVANDLLLLKETGSCPGVENYSRHFNLREAGEAPDTLLDYFGIGSDEGGNDDWLLVVDESHVALPQLSAMYGGDRARKQKLVKHGYRLPSAMDNRPLREDEFWSRIPQTLFVSATPSHRELQLAESPCVDMTIRPTFVPDPVIMVRPTQHQLDDLTKEVKARAEKNERTLALALTKRDAEDLSDFLMRHDIRADYIHSGLKTHDRSAALHALQEGKIDCLVGVNILREGLDLPQVSLVAILNADTEGFLRSETALTQMVGRAARNVNGQAILYANGITKSMKACMEATIERRRKQIHYNELHDKEMRSTTGSSSLSIFEILKDQIQAAQPLEVVTDSNRQKTASINDDLYAKPTITIDRSSDGDILTDHIPGKPGVYFWKGEDGDTLYIGKAKRLRSRVKSYLAPSAKHTQRIRMMLAKARNVEFILTPSERDALLLESALIKEHQPPYNVLLKDDTAYPLICASIGDRLPTFSLVPRPLISPSSSNYQYFGPYQTVTEINAILDRIESEYGLRSKHFQARYGGVTKDEYEEGFQRVLEEVFLTPKASQELPHHSSKLFGHEHNAERDIVSIATLECGVEALVHVVQLRSGTAVGQFSYPCKLPSGVQCDEDLGSLIQTVLEQQHYPQGEFTRNGHFFPKELLLHHKLPDAKGLRALFRQQRLSQNNGTKAATKLTIRTPAKRGKRKETDELAMSFATENAEEVLRQQKMAASEGALTSLDGSASKELAELLRLERLPNRIEAYDISHTHGDVAVGSRVVYEGGRPLKRDYRRFNIRTVGGIDDYASLEEVLHRRFSKAWINGEGGLVGADDPWKLPDLVLIDGGKGQISAALKGMAKAGIYASNGGEVDTEENSGRMAAVPVVSLAKNLEEVFGPDSSDPINDSPDSAALLLLRALRDESHRFALANHRRRRSKMNGLT